jgi:hypothetical protein
MLDRLTGEQGSDDARRVSRRRYGPPLAALFSPLMWVSCDLDLRQYTNTSEM